MSRPVRARGLNTYELKWLVKDGVRPRAGAWIETFTVVSRIVITLSRPVRARGLNTSSPTRLTDRRSRPVRARG